MRLVSARFSASAVLALPLCVTLTLSSAVAADPVRSTSDAVVDAPAESVVADAAERHAALVRTGESRYGWTWLAGQFDGNRDGMVTREELGGEADTFRRLDCTWDGVLTSDDFDWSTEGQLCSQKETVFALFKSADSDSDGRLSDEEWQALFTRIAGEKGYIHEEDLQRLIYLPRVVKARREQARFDRIEGFLSHARANFAPQLPAVGEMAPDFELKTFDGDSTVRLSSYRGNRPVVLIFGCFSCGNYRTYSETLEEVSERWKDEVAFVRVYVREAHPADDGRLTSTNARAGIRILQPTTLQERCEVAGLCARELNIDGPMVVDGTDNRVGKAYGGWPDRLYAIDRDGRVAYRGGPGPFGFNPREMEQSLVLMLIDQQRRSEAGP